MAYRPLLQTTFALNYALTGYDAWSWHLVNVLLHELGAMGAFALFRHLLPQQAALVAGLLCALHPVHSQAVNYLSSRSETMCMALVLWSLVLCQRPMSSAAVVLLPMAVLLEWRRPAVQRRWRGLIPHAILTVVYLSVISEHRLYMPMAGFAMGTGLLLMGSRRIPVPVPICICLSGDCYHPAK